MNDSSNKKNSSKLTLSRESLKDLTKVRSGLRAGVACNAGSCNDPTSESSKPKSRAACPRI